MMMSFTHRGRTCTTPHHIAVRWSISTMETRQTHPVSPQMALCCCDPPPLHHHQPHPPEGMGRPRLCSGLRLPVAGSISRSCLSASPPYATVAVAWQLRPCSANGAGMQQEVLSLTQKRESTRLTQLIFFFLSCTFEGRSS